MSEPAAAVQSVDTSTSSAATAVATPAAVSVDSSAASFHQVDREELGRATWTLLHTLGAQFPDKPTRRQQKDVQALVRLGGASLPDCYHCGERAHQWDVTARHRGVQSLDCYLPHRICLFVS